MKPVVWGWLARWQLEPAPNDVMDMNTLQGLAVEMKRERIGGLVHAYMAAHGWIVTPEDKAKLEALIGERRLAQLSCSFNCQSPYTCWSIPRQLRHLRSCAGGLLSEPERCRVVQTTERLSYQTRFRSAPNDGDFFYSNSENALEVSAAFHGAGHGDLVGVFDVGAGGDAGGDAGDAEGRFGVAKLGGEVACGGFALGGG